VSRVPWRRPPIRPHGHIGRPPSGSGPFGRPLGRSQRHWQPASRSMQRAPRSAHAEARRQSGPRRAQSLAAASSQVASRRLRWGGVSAGFDALALPEETASVALAVAAEEITSLAVADGVAPRVGPSLGGGWLPEQAANRSTVARQCMGVAYCNGGSSDALDEFAAPGSESRRPLRGRFSGGRGERVPGSPPHSGEFAAPGVGVSQAAARAFLGGRGERVPGSPPHSGEFAAPGSESRRPLRGRFSGGAANVFLIHHLTVVKSGVFARSH
jgi:hypothetical protein